jgi:hypothetical protein
MERPRWLDVVVQADRTMEAEWERRGGAMERRRLDASGVDRAGRMRLWSGRAGSMRHWSGCARRMGWWSERVARMRRWSQPHGQVRK